MQMLQYQVSAPSQSNISQEVAQHYVPPPPYFGALPTIVYDYY